MDGRIGPQTFVCLMTFILVCVLSKTEGIVCYQCADSTADGHCATDITGMLQTFTKFNKTGHSTEPDEIDIDFFIQTQYVKGCDGLDKFGHWGYGNYCIIQEVKQQEKTVGFIRDCSDGKTFPLTEKPYFPVFGRIPPDNQTVCGLIASNNGMLVCVSICTTDLCNGPQLPENGQTTRTMNSYIQTLCLSIITLLHVLLYQ